MFTRILVSGLFAGAIAGIVASILQLYFVQPILLHAELYEAGALVHLAQAGSANMIAELRGFDPARDLLTIGFTLVIYASYGLLINCAIALRHIRGHLALPHQGILWGLAGFFVLQLMPALGMPPQVPGAATLAIEPRQFWWGLTVICSAAGLWLFAFAPFKFHASPPLNAKLNKAVGVLLILIPHAVGAPMADMFYGSAPAEIGSFFSSAALGVSFIGWAVLGMGCVYFWNLEADIKNEK
ncbi:MAG: CbtA family protein [Alphaproteobacteria bacterium]